MITLPLIAIFAVGTVACWRFSDARVLHLVTAALFGLLLGSTPLGPELISALHRVAEALGASMS